MGGGHKRKKPAVSLKRCKVGPKLLWRTNIKSHTRFRLVPKSMTLDDLERPKRHSCRNKKNYGAHQKNFNKGTPVLSAAKCRPVILVSRNVRHMRIFCYCRFAVILRHRPRPWKSAYCVWFQHLNGHWCTQESRAATEKPHYVVVKFNMIEIYNGIARFIFR